MKKLLILLISVLVIYCIYVDLQSGTLPLSQVASAQEKEIKSDKQEKKNNTTYIEVTVKPGDTVLSILEKNLKGDLPVSITTVVKDFVDLNKVEPEKIQIGKKYKIPMYQ
ncbi:LysM peptidoglycan-binding domain-containing protein [Bacillus suaedaesalsae]|uniref:LysM peptidoglycan-binding domain-containing protein n=1 Tax=Bacillus suaedaesalsae TaxID=2810349 RepID=A0ABS2DFL6_9BACI|nr:LysM peptidoglycan-binding domain-containing protein [Bacillus suaedaesalsae]MBM6617232.1 LysM peptidoglycan-binding domain-containing protein [Bacillus suaedaesalsae]